MSSSRQAGFAQGVILSIMPLFAMMGAMLISPVLPAIEHDFAHTPRAQWLVPTLLTAPALCLGLLSPLGGRLTAKFGARRTLLAGLMFYGLAGTAPAYLPNLALIMASRLIVGIAEALIVTASAVMLSDYFGGDTRQKWFAYQTVVLTVLGSVLIYGNALLADMGWRISFYAYGLSFFVLVMAIRLLFEPSSMTVQIRTHRWRGIFPPLASTAMILGVAIPGSVAYYVAPVEIGFLLREKGFAGVMIAGKLVAGAVLLGQIGPLMSRFLTHVSMARVLILSSLLMAAGMAGMSIGRSLPTVGLGMALQQIGGGLMLTTGLTLTARLAPETERGRYMGAWFFFYMLAQFFAPMIVTLIDVASQTHARALLIDAILVASGSLWTLIPAELRRPVVA